MDEHTQNLDYLIEHLWLIKQEAPEWIIREGVWRRGCHQKRFPDLLLGYPNPNIMSNEIVIPVEIKRTFDKRNDAMEQLRNGRDYSLYKLHKSVPYSVFVVYDNLNFKFERITNYGN